MENNNGSADKSRYESPSPEEMLANWEALGGDQACLEERQRAEEACQVSEELMRLVVR